MTINLKTGNDFDVESNNQTPFFTSQVMDPAITAQIQGNPKGLRLPVDSKKRLWAHGALLTSPQNPLNQFAEIATVEPFLLSGANPQPGLVVHSYPTVFRGIGNMGVVSSGSYQDSLYGSPYSAAVNELVGYYLSGAQSNLQGMGALSSYTVSAINTTNDTGWVDCRDLHSTLNIYMTCSAGTATLLVYVSNDSGADSLLVDSIAAAATTIKTYDPATHLATTIALFPLAFRFIRIVAGVAGAGNTTTLYVGAK